MNRIRIFWAASWATLLSLLDSTKRVSRRAFGVITLMFGLMLTSSAVASAAPLVSDKGDGGLSGFKSFIPMWPDFAKLSPLKTVFSGLISLALGVGILLAVGNALVGAIRFAASGHNDMRAQNAKTSALRALYGLGGILGFGAILVVMYAVFVAFAKAIS